MFKVNNKHTVFIVNFVSPFLMFAGLQARKHRLKINRRDITMVSKIVQVYQQRQKNEVHVGMIKYNTFKASSISNTEVKTTTT